MATWHVLVCVSLRIILYFQATVWKHLPPSCAWEPPSRCAGSRHQNLSTWWTTRTFFPDSYYWAERAGNPWIRDFAVTQWLLCHGARWIHRRWCLPEPASKERRGDVEFSATICRSRYELTFYLFSIPLRVSTRSVGRFRQGVGRTVCSDKRQKSTVAISGEQLWHWQWPPSGKSDG